MALEEACEYGLLSRDTVTASNISCVHVKLTDSALKVIEDLKNGNRFVRPTIEVSDEQGVIRIPDGSGYKEFIFSVSPLAGDLNGSFDCIKQAKNGKLETLDTMSQKIVVKATDDVYKTTKEKLAVKNEESMKSRAKEIDQTKGGVKSKKVTKTIRNGATIAASRTSNSSQSNIKSTATTRNDWSPSTRSPNSLTPASSQNTSPPLSSTVTTAPQANNATYTSNKTAAKKLDQLKRKQQSKKNSVAKEAALAHNKTSGPTKSEKEKLKAALLNVPLRERIVHLLGAKPNQYNTPSVILRLKSEGLNPAMENSASADISRILETVAVSNSKSCWSLKDKFVNELDANWGFYTDTDKQLVSRLLARAPKPKPIVAVHPTHPNQPDTSKRKKDIESDSDDDFPMTKKEKYIAVQGENELTQSDTVHHSTENPPMNEDFLTSYPPPTKQSTRDKYRNDFNSEYEEYQTLLAYEGQLTKQFSDLQKRREKLDPQSDKFLRLDKKITRKYEKVNKDGKHKDRQERLAYLHRKLSHIKALVQEWDYVSLIQGQRPPPLAPHRPRAVVLPESTN